MGIQDEWRLADCEKKAREGSDCANQMYSVLSDIRQLESEMRETKNEIENIRQELYEGQQRIDELDHTIQLLEYPDE